MRRKGYRGVGCVKRSLSKCEGICRTYDKIQTSFADCLQVNEKVKSFQCNVLMENGDENQYTTDFVVEMYDGSKMVTGYKGFEQLHINMTELTYAKIGTVLQMLNEVFEDPQNTPKLDRDKVKAYIMEVKQAGLLNEDALRDELRKDIDKYCKVSN